MFFYLKAYQLGLHYSSRIFASLIEYELVFATSYDFFKTGKISLVYGVHSIVEVVIIFYESFSSYTIVDIVVTA